MGAYLSEPRTDKESTNEDDHQLRCAASSMQGWRVKQEDAHNVILDFDTDSSLFAVYDGHGGAEVAKYCSQKLPQFIKYTEAYKKGDYAQALENAFLDIDDTLTHPYVIQTLKTLSDEGSEAVTDDGSDEEENVHNLYEESRMPLEELIARYQNEVNSFVSHFKNENCTSSKPMSPNLRSKRAGMSSDGAGGSSSSSSSKCPVDEPEVSSACSSSSSSKPLANEPSVSSTTNGDHNLPESPADISSTNDSNESTKPTDLPNDKEVPAKENSEASVKSESKAKTPEPDDAKSNDAESSKSESEVTESKASECTTSPSTTAEITPEQSSPSSTRKRSTANYNSFLGLITADDDDDDSDSNDETFESKEDASSSEEENTVNGVSGDSSEDDGAEEEESSEEDEDEMNDFSMRIKNEPGSNSGCTAVVALLHRDQLYVANAGDSRCVVCRNGEAVDMSIDHKPEDDIELDRIIKAGGKVSKDGRVNGGLNLSRAIGDLGYKQNKSLGVKEQMITAFPDVKTLTINRETDKFIVLACDGIWNFMSSQNVVNFVSERLAEGREKLSQICEEMFDHCLAPNTLGDGTGCDNMTALIIVFKSDKTSEIAVSKKRPSDNEEADNQEDTQAKRLKTDSDAGSVSSSA
ncbi:putative protein phosphatase CG10417 isoform X2 [Arctopsyche grandis]|uniref:putative protein phosphatase CG10417 isoform X2 n=1 Tax=Arctopsyche grandis TaxID=121162 RepID=UPI00406DA15B